VHHPVDVLAEIAIAGEKNKGLGDAMATEYRDGIGRLGRANMEDRICGEGDRYDALAGDAQEA
jgi:hypothetical protein